MTEPALLLTAALTLALGVGSTVLMTDLLDRLLLRPPTHVSAPERVARVYFSSGTASAYFEHTNYPTVERLATGLGHGLESWATYLSETLSLGRGAEARKVAAVSYSDGYFDVLGLTPALGVLPSARRPATPDAAVISEALWQRAFGGRRDVLGQPLRLGTDVFTIVGVTPRGFAGIDLDPVDVWLPLDTRAPTVLFKPWKTSHGYFMLRMIVRLTPETDRARLQQRAAVLYTTIERERPHGRKDAQGRIALAELPPARAPRDSRLNRVEVWVTGVALLVLLIACGNVGNLMLVRGLRRAHELAVKSALGASRRRLVREILVEACVLALLSGAAALGFIVIGGGLIRELFLPPIAALASPIDERLIALTVVVSVAAAFLLGMVPALRLTTRRALTPGRAHAGAPASRFVEAFIGLQVALSVPLVVGAGLFVVSFWQARTLDVGLQTDRVAIVRTDLDEVGDEGENHAAHRRIQARLAALPFVDSAALVQTIPMHGMRAGPLEIRGGKSTAGLEGPYGNGVDPSYFDVVRPHIVAGRRLVDADNHTSARPVALVNEAMARAIWPGESALGKCLQIGGAKAPCAEIVGIMADARKWARIDADTAPMYVAPIEQIPTFASSRALLVRTKGDAHALLATLRQDAQAAGANLPYVDVSLFDEIFQPMLRPWRLGATLFLAFGAMSLTIAAVGLAVVTAYGVTRRTRELGIRTALGATPRRLVALILGRSLTAVLAGLAAGVVLAYVGGRAMVSILFGITPADPRVFTIAAVLLLTIGAMAAWLPARRAGRVDPAVTLRTE